ncbi:DUF5336 domain-containing protein [Mycolicibacterium tusciae]|uniref:DUF5336 domain-containing protein n=1 Tax=Mycolicibacterium tusciae TaxID=75922 RepID=UPI00024A1ED9|nr:DUF5336 domain-containing protein [Mycolicibacterium tusciae]
MSYPQGPPGNPGYPSAQQPTNQFSAPTQQFVRAPESGPAAPAGPSQLPMYLTIAVVVLGLGAYLSSFGPLFTAGADYFTPTLLDLGLVAAIAAGLIAGVSLLPKQKFAPAVIAVLSVLAFLLVIAIVLTAPEGVSIDWGLYLIIAFTLFQAIVAVAVLLFDAGVITPPAPQPPRYEPQYGQYGNPGGQYYGQPPHGGPQQPQQQGLSQRPGYPSQYGGYQAGQTTVGYAGGQQGGPPTPPTGFPTFGQPPPSSAPTTQAPMPTQSAAPSPQSDPPPS